MTKYTIKIYFSHTLGGGMFGVWTSKGNEENQFETDPNMSSFFLVKEFEVDV